MFALRRAAVRALQFQPTRQLSTLRPVSSKLQIQKPTLYRSFHQSWRWLAEQDQKESPAEAQGGETVTAEPEAQTGIKEESIATSDVADAAQESSTESKSATQIATDALSSAAETVQNAASSVEATAQQTFPPRNSPTEKQPSRILYVGNLFFEVTAANLESEFSRYGEITNSRVVSDNRGLSKGFGYIEFASQESADRALRELDQKVFQGRRMAVQYHVRREPRQQRSRRDQPPSKTLFVGNMSYQMSDRDLNDLFREVKNVLDVRVAIDRRSGQPRGFAHADFIDIPSAEKAKEFLEKKVVYGRQLRVDFSSSSTSQPSS